jgi:hypothetical protein
MAYCAKCGNPLVEGQQFCATCGQRAADGEAAAPPAATPAPMPVASPSTPAVPPGWSYTPEPQAGPGGYPPGQNRRSLKWLWITIAAVVVVAAVTCAAVLVPSHEETKTTASTIAAVVVTTEGTGSTADTTTGGTTASTSSGTTASTGSGSTAATPEEAVRKVFDAMEKKDIDAYFAMFDPVALEDALQGISIEDVKAEVGASMFDYKSMKFSDLELSTEMTSDTTATVTVVGGTVSITDLYGATESEDVTAAGESVFFDFIKRDGAWYLDPISMFGGV